MNQERTIGILLPQSNAYPLIGKEFINGLKLALADTNYQLAIESIGFGADPKQTLNAAQKLVFQEDVFLTTGLIGHYGFEEIADYFSKNEETLLAATMGATAIEKTPKGVYQNSLDLFNALKDLVRYFSDEGKENIATSSCYYEAGYGFLQALDQGVQAHNNTTFAGHFITPLEPRENEEVIMEESFKAFHPDAIVAFHNGVYAEEHAAFLNKNKIHKEYPLYCLPFSCEDKLIQAYPDVFNHVQIVSSWFAELDIVENKTFINAYNSNYAKSPSFFALLGYENGLIIKALIEADKHAVNAKIAELTVNGPRGPIEFSANGKTQYDNYLWEVETTENGSLKRKNIARLKTSKPAQETPLTTETAGWFNAYLCH